MNFLLFLISYGVFQGFFILLFFIFSKKVEKTQKFLLILLIISLSILSTDYVLSNYYLISDLGAFFGIGWSSSFWLIIAPLYYLLFCSFLTYDAVSVRKIVLHSIPFIISFFFNLPFFVLPAETRQEYLLSYSSGQDISVIHIISKGIYHIQLLIYPLLILRIVKQKKISQLNFSSIINIGLLLVGIGSFLHLVSFNLFGFSISWLTSKFVFISLTLFIHATALLLILRPDWMFKPIDELIAKYSISNLSNVDVEKVRDELDKLMNQQRIYLQQDLSLSKLAKLISISSHQLSEFLNRNNSQSFNDYVNSYRVIEAKNVLTSSEYNLLTIEAIANKVGFNSAATFYRSFKKQTGFSPTKWIEQQQKGN